MNINRIKKLFLSAMTLGCFTTSAQAMDIYPVAGINYDKGGDPLATFYYTDGTSDTIYLGDGLTVFLGAEMELNENKNFFLDLTVGVKEGAINRATNGSASVKSYPVEAMLFYRLGKHRFGVGATQHMEMSIETSGVLTGFDVELESQIGAIVEYGMTMDDKSKTFIGVRYTELSYDLPEYGLEKKANSAGIFLKSGF